MNYGVCARGGCYSRGDIVYIEREVDDTLHIKISTAARPSVVLCDQIKTVDARRLGRWFGRITDAEATALDRAMKKALIMQDAPRPETETGQLQKLLTEARAEAKAWKEIALQFCGGVRPVKIVGTEKETDWLPRPGPRSASAATSQTWRSRSHSGSSWPKSGTGCCGLTASSTSSWTGAAMPSISRSSPTFCR